jgi:hypothetical protein
VQTKSFVKRDVCEHNVNESYLKSQKAFARITRRAGDEDHGRERSGGNDLRVVPAMASGGRELVILVSARLLSEHR